MRRQILAVLFLIACLPARELCACQCGTVPSAKELLERSPVAFQGVVVNKTPRLVRVEHGWFIVEEWTFAIQKAWKGVRAAKVTVRQGYSNCTNIYNLGEQAVVFAVPGEADSSTLETSKCRTARGTVEEQIAELGPPVESFSPNPFGGESTIHLVARHTTVYLLVGIAAAHNVFTLPKD